MKASSHDPPKDGCEESQGKQQQQTVGDTRQKTLPKWSSRHSPRSRSQLIWRRRLHHDGDFSRAEPSPPPCFQLEPIRFWPGLHGFVLRDLLRLLAPRNRVQSWKAFFEFLAGS